MTDDGTRAAEGDDEVTADARCPHLTYRTAADGRRFETARAYCTVTEAFVEPMRADICNRRYDLEPAEHCEIYREAASE